MKKIMFNDKYGLTRSVLDGKKTMTRRIIKDKYGLYRDLTKCNKRYIHKDNTMRIDFGNMVERRVDLPYKIGEIVAIAQSYKDVNCAGYPVDSRYDSFRTAYYSVGSVKESDKGWSNKMFVKSDLMPHHIKITDIKVERLQDISDEDCLKEGIRLYTTGIPQCKTQVVGSLEFIPPYGFEDYNHKKFRNFDTPREAFAALIDKVSGKGTWNSNPWVFVYEFELVK